MPGRQSWSWAGGNHGASGRPNRLRGELLLYGYWRRESVVISLIVLLLVVWLILILLGLLVKGLFWLIVVGTVLFVATAIVGWVKRNA